MTAILAGATGLVGSECARLLPARYGEIIALVRRPAGIPNERVIDFDRLAALDFPMGAHVYCALGTTIKKAGSQAAFRRVDFDYPLALAERAAAARGKFILVSSVGADPKSRNFYLCVKGDLEERVRALPLEACHIFHPSFLVGRRVEKRGGEAFGIAIARTAGPLLIGGLRKYRAVEAATVARAMIAAANKPVAGCFIYHYDEIREIAG